MEEFTFGPAIGQLHLFDTGKKIINAIDTDAVKEIHEMVEPFDPEYDRTSASICPTHLSCKQKMRFAA